MENVPPIVYYLSAEVSIPNIWLAGRRIEAALKGESKYHRVCGLDASLVSSISPHIDLTKSTVLWATYRDACTNLEPIQIWVGMIPHGELGKGYNLNVVPRERICVSSGRKMTTKDDIHRLPRP